MLNLSVQGGARHILGAACILVWSAAVRADDSYFQIPFADLKITDGALPTVEPAESTSFGLYGPSGGYLAPYAVLDGVGEVYVTGMDPYFGGYPSNVERSSVRTLCIRGPHAAEISGTLYVPNASRSGLNKVRFKIPASAADPKAHKSFYEAKEHHFRLLLDHHLPGGAWFRYEVRQAQAALAGKSVVEFEAQMRPETDRFERETEFAETFNVFSGGRAISENLQLDRLLPTTSSGESTIELASLPGITVAEMDFRPLVKEIHPELDPLAALIPSDQHGLFFPSFNAMLSTIDEADRDGTPVIQLIEGRAEDVRTRQRYERQLCLPLDALSRLLGDKVIASVAFTGSDPYLPTGSDVAVLFEARNAAVLKSFIAAQQAAAIKTDPRCQKVAGSISDVKYTGAVSPDRRVCSYTTQLGPGIVVTNSLVQLKRIMETSEGRAKSLASLPEYRFFRDRYRRGTDETGLLIVTDQTIRRWCGAKWRIASSRRTRAAAILSNYQAEYLDDLVQGKVEPHNIHTLYQLADLGTLRVTPEGVTSSTYGTLDFQTPIAELDFTRVTKTESDAYKRWRDTYQQNWSQFFDPIAIRFSIKNDRLIGDVSVMPLIESSQYREFIEIVSGVDLKPGAGDPHTGSLAHLVLAINPKSERMKWASNFLEGPVKVNLLSWLGESVSVYADADPFWNDVSRAAKTRASTKPGEDPTERFFEENVHRLPVALTAEVRDSLKLTLFLSGIRAFIEQTAPGLVNWTSQEYHGQHYVKITATENGRGSMPFASKLAILYAPTPRLLIVTLNEDLLKRALDRLPPGKTNVAPSETATSAGQMRQDRPKPAGEITRPWLGKSMALQLDRQVIELLEQVFGPRAYQALMQARAWSNIPILNEWKRLYPDRDPVALQERIWHTSLVSPGGGTYVWNKEFQTMESTVYGEPGQPKMGPTIPAPLKNVRWIDFGVTFENRGLRAKAEIRREAKK
jgi:hypothetical protein